MYNTVYSIIGTVDNFVDNWKIYKAFHYGNLDAPKTHGCAQMSPLINSWHYRCVHMGAYQIFAKKPIIGSLEVVQSNLNLRALVVSFKSHLYRGPPLLNQI